MVTEAYHDFDQIIDEDRIKDNKPIPFDFKKASEVLLKNDFGKENRYLHYIHYYPGRIYPYIPLYILSLADFSDLDGYVLDPFAGSGTILLESIINPVLKRNAFGVEINPIARLISKVKTTVIDFTEIDRLMRELSTLYLRRVDTSDYVPRFDNLNFWFFPHAIKKLSKLKYAIENLNVSVDFKDFFWVCFSSTVRKVSKADPYIPPPVLLKLKKYENNPLKYQKLQNFLKKVKNPDVWNLFENAVKNNRGKIENLIKIKELRNGEVKAEIIWDDARDLKRGHLVECGRIDKNHIEKLPSNVDIIFTSPPYLTAQKYIRTNKLELFWLGYSMEELIELERKSIGSERVLAKYEIASFGVDSLDSLIDYAYSKDKGRGIMVYKYFENMIKALDKMNSVLNENGYAIFVVGNNKVLGKKVETYRLLIDAAVSLNFSEVVTLKDEIRTRSMMTSRNGTGGLIKNEYIIILKKGR
jgi:DNA modification methylase